MFVRRSRKNQTDMIVVHGQPAAGDDPLNITAVESTQTTWDMTDRRHWPDELTLWNRPTPWTRPTFDIGILKYKGRVVLDCDDNPIRNFRIPLTISSQVEGLRIEAWIRQDDRLTLKDIVARMWTIDYIDKGKKKKKPRWDKRALSKRASNARARVGLISWATKKGRERQIEFLDGLRTEAQRESNQATDKDLTARQKAEHQLIGFNPNKKSNAPTRQGRIDKIRRKAAGTSSTAAGPSSEAADAGPSDSAAKAGGDDILTDDTDVEGAAEEALVQDQPSDEVAEDEISVSSSLLDPVDSRHDQPTSLLEEALLEIALENTREDFVRRSGQQPQPTDPRDNYFSQWGMLQVQFSNMWVAEGNEDLGPRLAARDRWTGGIDRYHLADLLEGGWDDDESDEAQEEGA